MSERYLIVGLGNPGLKYAKTRHNIGFMVIDELARRHNIEVATKERKALVGDGLIHGKRVLLAKPQTYMNASGESVRALVDFYKIELERIIIIHDDLDTPFGKLKIRKNGGHGGQNGVRNIIQHLGTRDFARIRCGIGRPPGKMDPVDYVLQPFSAEQQMTATELIERAANAVETWLQEGIEIAMSRYNGNGEPQKQPKLDPKEQLKIYQRAHELAPDDPEPLEKLIGVLKRMGRVDEAAARHVQLAELLFKQGRAGQARSQLERAASLHPGMTGIHERIVQAYIETGNIKKAVQRWLIYADYLMKTGAYEQALKAIDSALELNPQHPKALNMKMALKKRMLM
ncbi:MAG: aminoacyl-tRNA hydrolase [Chloroflexi bacterium]|nr:MAG: aminoacyl-tRNA hydrolase [Chloroflexota bacterium]